jgi:hypothetical protein
VWPWEHLAIAYVAVSLLARSGGRRVGGPEAVALAVGSQFPDLVDKPLAWGLGALPSGTTLAHSVFVAVPVCLLAWQLGRRAGYGSLGVAFGLAYALHLPADVLYGPLTVGGTLSLDPLLWPLVAKAGGSAGGGLLAEAWFYVERYRSFLATPRALGYIALELSLLLSALALWVSDGYPGVRLLTGRPTHQPEEPR